MNVNEEDLLEKINEKKNVLDKLLDMKSEYHNLCIKHNLGSYAFPSQTIENLKHDLKCLRDKLCDLRGE